MSRCSEQPSFGILAWDNELNQTPGALIHPDTFGFPTLVERVPGANFETVVKAPAVDMACRFAAAARRLVQRGATCILSTTGLTVVFQDEIQRAVSVPVVTSALLLLPFLNRVLPSGSKIGVITAGHSYLRPEHLIAARADPAWLEIESIEDEALFARLALIPSKLESNHAIEEVAVRKARQLLAREPRIGCLLIEVTGLCAGAPAIRRALAVPVFDIVETAYFFHAVQSADRWKSLSAY